MSPRPTIHASCVVIGEAGVLVRGPSGSGKSSFAAALIAEAAREGLFARLVADDGVRLRVAHGRLIASVPDAIAGKIERRGLGVVDTAFLKAAVVRLVVDLETSVPRMPEPGALVCEVEGVGLARLPAARGDVSGPALALLRLRSPIASDDCGVMALAFARQDEKISLSTGHPPKVRSGRARVACGGQRPERNEFCAESA